jgi:hypothetical protein
MNPTSEAPDWSQSEDVLCPLCEYNLRGLSEPRCPECGFKSDWQELTDISRRQHPYLFEHHPRRNFWSFFQTMMHALRPRQFWKTLSPAQPLRLRRLVLYWLIAMVIALLPTTPQVLSDASQFAATMRTQRLMYLNSLKAAPQLRAHAMPQKTIELFWPLPPQPRFFQYLLSATPILSALASVAVAYALWAWIAFATLMIFQMSLRRAKIKPAHVLRCTIYSGDCGVALCAAIVFVGLMALRQIIVFLPTFPIRQLAWWAALLVLWGGITFRLIRAYQLYLRFPRAGAVVISVQVIFFLLMAEVLTLTLRYPGVSGVLFLR